MRKTPSKVDEEVEATATNQPPSPFPPWSQLPTELLELVARRIPRLSDYLRFRSVCRTWRFAARPSCLHPQPPLLLLLPRRSFFSLATRTIHPLSLPDEASLPGAKVALGSGHGWLVMLDVFTRSLSLLNPVSSAELPLPPTAGFSYQRPFAWAPALSSSPCSPSCVVTILHCYPDPSVAAFCRPRDASWTPLCTGLPEKPSSIAYHDGRFFAVDQISGNVHVCDAAAPSLPTEVASLKAPRENHRFCFAKARGELFLCGIRSVIPNLYDKVRLEVYKLALDGGPLKWTKVDSIGDRAFFLSDDQLLMCDVSDFPECKRDCIYSAFALDESLEEEEDEELWPKVGVFSLQDGACGLIPCGLEADVCDRPIWVTPTLS